MSKLFLLSISALLLVAFQGFSASPIGRVISVKGKAYLAHALKKKSLAKVGDEIFAKDKIKTKEGAEVVLDMNGASKITIGPKSYFKVKKSVGPKGSKTNINLFSGQVKCKVNKLGKDDAFTVKTPSAVAGVRGTDFYTMVDDDLNSAVFVEEGEVMNGSPEHFEDAQSVTPGTTGLVMPDGTKMVAMVDTGANVGQMLDQMVAGVKEETSSEALNTYTERMNEEALLWVDINEDRLKFLEGETASLVLPSAPSTPQNN